MRSMKAFGGLTAAILALACGAAAAGGLPRNENAYHTGDSVSDAYVDPEKYAEGLGEIKAMGYEYDEKNLTWELVWADEFDTDGKPDPKHWTYDTGGGGWGNNELQYYTPGDNVNIENGLLTIECRKEEMGGREYTSTRLVTRKLEDWLYCKVEARAKLPSGKGTWPAIWMLPTDWVYGGWPASGEIDIMEHVGYDPNVIVQTVHCAKYYGATPKNHSMRVDGVMDEFHTYGLEWLPDQIIFSVDGEETFRYRPTDYTEHPNKDVWPFDKRMHLLVNLAFGGNWGGYAGIDEGCLPAVYQLDYVRVYQSPEIMRITGQSADDRR